MPSILVPPRSMPIRMRDSLFAGRIAWPQRESGRQRGSETVCLQNAVDKGMGLGPERRVEMAFSRRAEQFRKAGIRYEMDEMRGRMCLCDRGQIVRNVIKKDDRGLHTLGKAANSAALEASIRDNGEWNVLLGEARL